MDTAIFGLTRGDLAGVVDALAPGETVVSFDVSVSPITNTVYGNRGDKLAATFHYRTGTGAEGRVPVFVKRYCDPGPAEAQHYRSLAALGAPLPALYAVREDGEGREILFLESLHAAEPEDRLLEDPKSVRAFLSTVAHFNAITPSAEYAAGLAVRDIRYLLGEKAQTALDRLRQHAWSGELGDQTKSFCSGARIARLQAIAYELIIPILDMPTGLIVGDFHPHHTGWRPESGELLIFDLELVAIGPRFTDVATWLGTPAKADQKPDLIEHYIEAYARQGGESITKSQFLAESNMLWIAWMLSHLDFDIDRALHGPPRDEFGVGRDEYREGLRELLRVVLAGAEAMRLR
jgi:hypothetical protein